jgi:DNA-binding CsgD family transcriptional regulator
VFLQQRGVELVSRLNKAHRRADFRRGRRLGDDDHIVRWFKPTSIRSLDRKTYQALPESITFREARIPVTQPGFRTTSIVVVTTLLDPQQMTKEDLATLYRARWNNELDLRSIKSTTQMRDLRSLSDREFQVLRQLSSGKTVAQIADQLLVSVKTISTYRQNSALQTEHAAVRDLERTLTDELRELRRTNDELSTRVVQYSEFNGGHGTAANNASGIVNLLRPFPPERMRFDAVSRTVNNARNEGPDCIEPARQARLLQKMHMRTTAELMRYAICNGLVD